MQPSSARGKRAHPSVLAGPLAILATLAVCASQDLHAAPRLEVDPVEIDLGDIGKGESKSVEFQIRNTGDALLEVLGADSACGCTVTTFDRSIPVGGTGKVSATLNTETLDGDVGKSIVLLTNDPARPKVVLVLRANILRSIITLPDDRMIVRNFKDDGVAQILVRRDASESGKLKISGVRTTADWLVATAKELDDIVPPTDEFPTGRPEDWLIVVRTRGKPPYGPHRASVEFDTGLPRQPHVSIPVFADISPPVALPEPKLQLSSAPSEQTIILSVRNGLDPTGLRAEARPEGLSVALESGGGRFYKAHVRWKGGPPQEGAAVSFLLGDERLDLPVEFTTASP